MARRPGEARPPVTPRDPVAAFIEASVWHGGIERAEAILASHPEVASSGIHAAAILGDDVAVREFLRTDPANATATGGPRGWDALTHLCFSRFLRTDRTRSDGFVRAAEALLDAGASARTGFHDPDHQPAPSFESALYGAAGVAHHTGVTRLLVAHGADVNDDEVVYHAPETWDNEAVKVLVESGRMTADSMAIMLVRKHDWHDADGVSWLLGKGADPNRVTRWGRTALQHAVLRDNSVAVVETLLEHRADPALAAGGRPAVVMAAWRGRDDLLALFSARSIAAETDGADALVAACARHDRQAVATLAARDPRHVRDVIAGGGKLLAEFAGNDNAGGVECLIDLGVDVAARFEEGDGYWDVAPGSTALHVAAWRARHRTVERLIARGAPVNVTDGKGRTPLALAVRACVDSYWTRLRSPESVAALLGAGASIDGIKLPSGYPEVDALVAARGRSSGTPHAD